MKKVFALFAALAILALVPVFAGGILQQPHFPPNNCPIQDTWCSCIMYCTCEYNSQTQSCGAVYSNTYYACLAWAQQNFDDCSKACDGKYPVPPGGRVCGS